MRRTWNKTKLAKAVKDSKSIAGTLRILGLRPHGGNYLTIKRAIATYKIKCDHFTGQAWGRGFRVGVYKSKAGLRRFIVETRGHKCQHCGRRTWNSKPIMLEMDHVNGVNGDNRVDNLRLLCPNCHAQTPTWRNQRREISEQQE